MSEMYYKRMGIKSKHQKLKVPRRLKAEIVTNVESLLGLSLPSMKNMVVKDLESLESFLEGEV